MKQEYRDLLARIQRPAIKAELIAYARQVIENDGNLTDDWFSFNDWIDINVFDNINATAYPVILGEPSTEKGIKLIVDNIDQ
jgi:hypothetical protein